MGNKLESVLYLLHTAFRSFLEFLPINSNRTLKISKALLL